MLHCENQIDSFLYCWRQILTSLVVGLRMHRERLRGLSDGSLSEDRPMLLELCRLAEQFSYVRSPHIARVLPLTHLPGRSFASL